MNEKQLQKIQDEIMGNLDKEDKVEQEIIESSKSLTSELMTKKIARTKLNDVDYTLKCKIQNFGLIHKVVLIGSDDVKFKIAQGKYKPAMLMNDFDKRMSEFENIRVVVEAFLRLRLDRVKAEEL